MFSKKAQGEVITTVLIILLVLAAIVIVWQVVNNTVKKGGEAISTQSECLGFTITLSKATADNKVNAVPSKDAKIIIYENNAVLGDTGSSATTAGSTFTSSVVAVGGGSTITAKGKITPVGTTTEVLCDGMNSITMP